MIVFPKIFINYLQAFLFYAPFYSSLQKNERISIMNFANNLKQLRQGHHMTQEALARYLNVTRPTIAGYETKNKQPDYDKLQKIAEIFEVSIDYLLTGNETSILLETNGSIDPSQSMQLEKMLLKYFSQLSSSSKQELVNFSKFLYLQEHNRLK